MLTSLSDSLVLRSTVWTSKSTDYITYYVPGGGGGGGGGQRYIIFTSVIRM